jgi:hypothetical protein
MNAGRPTPMSQELLRNANTSADLSDGTTCDDLARSPSADQGVSLIVGSLRSVIEGGLAEVMFYQGSVLHLEKASALVKLTAQDEGREVALLFERGDIDRPIVLGVLQRGLPEAKQKPVKSGPDGPELEIRVDDKTIYVSSGKQITLRCGKASIVLTRAGKILIQGEYISSRSSGVNRIKGGSVQIN